MMYVKRAKPHLQYTAVVSKATCLKQNLPDKDTLCTLTDRDEDMLCTDSTYTICMTTTNCIVQTHGSWIGVVESKHVIHVPALRQYNPHCLLRTMYM